jgi:hypothetical protein
MVIFGSFGRSASIGCISRPWLRPQPTDDLCLFLNRQRTKDGGKLKLVVIPWAAGASTSARRPFALCHITLCLLLLRLRLILQLLSALKQWFPTYVLAFAPVGIAVRWRITLAASCASLVQKYCAMQHLRSQPYQLELARGSKGHKRAHAND